VISGALLGTLMLGLPLWVGLLLGALLLGSATLGDLVESLIKRDLDIKDISSWLPGHGGFLDRLDSMLPSMAMLYVMLQIFG
jgi:phosphatidate cytidylyltransferase